jgi:hypothetical protein
LKEKKDGEAWVMQQKFMGHTGSNFLNGPKNITSKRLNCVRPVSRK